MTAPKPFTRKTYNAVLEAEAVNVLCPHCSEPQPDPEAGSHMWTKSQVTAKDGALLTCVSCDGRFKLWLTRKVSF